MASLAFRSAGPAVQRPFWRSSCVAPPSVPARALPTCRKGMYIPACCAERDPAVYLTCLTRGFAGPRRRPLEVKAGRRAAAAAAAAAVAPPVLPLLQPELAFSAATYIMVPVYCLLAFAPRSRLVSLVAMGARMCALRLCSCKCSPGRAMVALCDCMLWQYAPRPQAQAVLKGAALPLAFALAYAVLAWQAVQDGGLSAVQRVLAAAQPLPDASMLAALFQHKTLAALAWLHLLLLDFLAARHAQQAGRGGGGGGHQPRLAGVLVLWLLYNQCCRMIIPCAAHIHSSQYR